MSLHIECLKEFSKRHKRNLITIIFSALILSSSVLAVSLDNTQTISEETEATVVTEATVTTSNYTFATEIIYSDNTMTAQTAILEETPLVSSVAEGTALYIDGVFIGAAENASDIQTALDTYLEQCLENIDGDNKTADFVQEISTESGFYEIDELLSEEDILSLLQSTDIVEEDYTVLEGDTIESICEEFDMSEAELEVLNESTDFEVGDVIKIWKQKKLLSVRVTATYERTEVTPYETVVVYDDTQSAEVSYVSQTGQSGVTAYTDEVVYIDGCVESSATINEKVISSLIDEEITQGTIEHMYGYATGTFLWPLPYTTDITSGFGSRWGTTHAGIDIASSGVYGADIIASDGGTVTYAAYDESGYGLHIIIDHGNGIQTHYAHCSELYVSVGDEVYAGQVIAAVGSTGDSTGAHLHFEIIIDGVQVDPTDYL